MWETGGVVQPQRRRATSLSPSVAGNATRSLHIPPRSESSTDNLRPEVLNAARPHGAWTPLGPVGHASLGMGKIEAGVRRLETPTRLIGNGHRALSTAERLPIKFRSPHAPHVDGLRRGTSRILVPEADQISGGPRSLRVSESTSWASAQSSCAETCPNHRAQIRSRIRRARRWRTNVERRDRFHALRSRSTLSRSRRLSSCGNAAVP